MFAGNAIKDPEWMLSATFGVFSIMSSLCYINQSLPFTAPSSTEPPGYSTVPGTSPRYAGRYCSLF
jgi:hypothetical protein